MNTGDNVELATRYAIAECDTLLYLIDYNNFMALLQNITFAQAVLCSTVEKSTILRHEVESVTFDSTLDRLKRLLQSCANPGAVEDGNGAISLWIGRIKILQQS